MVNLQKLEREVELAKNKMVKLHAEQKKILALKKLKSKKIHGKDELSDLDHRLRQIIAKKKRLLSTQKKLSMKISHFNNV
ncbi:MAG: hypothetical protein ACTSRK_18575 [Promethearchaeota archaeon]